MASNDPCASWYLCLFTPVVFTSSPWVLVGYNNLFLTKYSKNKGMSLPWLHFKRQWLPFCWYPLITSGHSCFDETSCHIGEKITLFSKEVSELGDESFLNQAYQMTISKSIRDLEERTQLSCPCIPNTKKAVQ